MNGKKLSSVLFLLVVLAGTYLRFQGLSLRPLWEDEAESCINALTILSHGVPVDHYQGLPIYENTLVEPWPESREYEFRDSSYSRGVAVYHGWLPLYAIAASFKVFGVAPAPESTALNVRYSGSERVRRTWVPRVPSVLFGLIGMVALYIAGYSMGGKEAAWAALIAAAFAAGRIQVDQQARYYAATVAISTLCTLTVWRVYTKRGWRDVAFCAFSLTLLFYTHILTFAGHCAVLAILALFELLRRRRLDDILKFAAIGIFVAAFTVPWLLATGFLTHRSTIPRAWLLLNIRADVSRFLFQRADHTAELTFALILLVILWVFQRRLPEKLSTPLKEFAGPAAYLSLQMAVSSALFLYLIPAASLFWDRLTLSVAAPILLLQSLLVAVLARAVSERHAAMIASFSALLLLIFAGRLRSPDTPEMRADSWRKQNLVVDFLEGKHYAAGTRIYTVSNAVLLYSYLSGLPIQSIAPVRKSFLDSYAFPIVFVDAVATGIARGDPLDPLQMQAAAQAEHEHLTLDQGERLSLRCVAYLSKSEIERNGSHLQTDIGSLPAYAKSAAYRQLALVRLRDEQETQVKNELPIFRAYPSQGINSWWPIFAYRFVDPLSRMGPRANYAARMSNASARIIQGTPWVYFLSASAVKARSHL